MIDLRIYAEYSMKVPAEITSPLDKGDRRHNQKILLAHSADFMMSMIMVCLVAGIFAQNMNTMLVTSGLSSAFSPAIIGAFGAMISPFAILNYFFFSYLMNHGQSWGLYLVKKRVELRHMSFVDALTWASHSTLLILSAGLSFIIKREIWKSIKDQDYLYDHLMTHKDYTDIGLLQMVERMDRKDLSENQWKKAA